MDNIELYSYDYSEDAERDRNAFAQRLENLPEELYLWTKDGKRLERRNNILYPPRAAVSQTSKALADALVSNKEALNSVTSATENLASGTKKIAKESKKAKDEIDGFNATLQGFYMEFGASGARFVQQIPNQIRASIKAFGQQEMATQKLASAIRSQGGSVSEVLPIMRELASEIQRITTIGDEQVLAMQSIAMATGVASEQMDACIRGAIGLSNAFGLGLNEAIKAAASVLQGKTEKLNELIPALSKCKTEEERLALAQKTMNAGFAQARAEAETSIGKIRQCANAWGDLSETVGGMFAPAAASVASLLSGICEWLSKSDLAVLILTESLTASAFALSFAKIGGLASVVRWFKLKVNQPN